MNNQELRIEILLEEVVKKRASDLHIQVGLPPMLRIDGSLMPAAGTQPLDEPAVERLVFQILDEDERTFAAPTWSGPPSRTGANPEPSSSTPPPAGAWRCACRRDHPALPGPTRRTT